MPNRSETEGKALDRSEVKPLKTWVVGGEEENWVTGANGGNVAPTMSRLGLLFRGTGGVA